MPARSTSRCPTKRACRWGVRPPSLGEPPRPAIRVGRGQQPGTLEQSSLDAPVLQMVDQLMAVRCSLMLPSRLSKCLRFLLRMGTCSAPPSGRRNCLNSWWKCQPSLFLLSRSLTIRFRVVVFLDMEVFKVFSQNRVKLRLVEQIIVRGVPFSQDRALLRLVEQIIVLTLQFVVFLALDVLKVYAQDRFEQRLLEQNMELFTVYAQKRVQRRFSEVQALVEVLKTLSQYRVQVVVMMLGVMVTTLEQRTYHWHWRDCTTRWRLPSGVRHWWVRVLTGCYVHVESQAEAWMLPDF